jgi:hypothetical protein
MHAYRPPQRTVVARVLTPSGWLRGAFHVPRAHAFSEFLGAASPFLSLTGVALPGRGEEIPYLALRRSAALVILPACDESLLLLPPDPPRATVRAVTCVLAAGAVQGRIVLKPHARLSDHLARQEGFVVLREADVGPARTRVPLLFLNAGALLAVAEHAVEARASAPAATYAPAAERRSSAPLSRPAA